MSKTMMFKFYFQHHKTKKKYLVGAYDRDEASEMMASICGDFDFYEIDPELMPEEYR